MADFPSQGGDSGDWGTKLITFFKRVFHMAGSWGGEIAIVCNENQVVCNEDKVVCNVDWSIQ